MENILSNKNKINVNTMMKHDATYRILFINCCQRIRAMHGML